LLFTICGSELVLWSGYFAAYSLESLDLCAHLFTSKSQ